MMLSRKSLRRRCSIKQWKGKKKQRGRVKRGPNVWLRFSGGKESPGNSTKGMFHDGEPRYKSSLWGKGGREGKSIGKGEVNAASSAEKTKVLRESTRTSTLGQVKSKPLQKPWGGKRKKDTNPEKKLRYRSKEFRMPKSIEYPCPTAKGSAHSPQKRIVIRGRN